MDGFGWVGAAMLFDLQQKREICKFRPGPLDLAENATSIFGFSVAQSANYLAIGNPTAIDKTFKSTVHVYSLDLASKANCTFVNMHKLELPEHSVDTVRIRHTYMCVCYLAYVSPGSEWVQRSDFGFSLALAEQDDTAWLAIGARYYFPWNATDPSKYFPVTSPMGAVYVLRNPKPSSGNAIDAPFLRFVYSKKITDKQFELQTILQDISFQYGDSLGSSLSFNHDATVLAVGAVQDSAHTVEAGVGKVVLYQRTPQGWKQQGSLTDASGHAHDQVRNISKTPKKKKGRNSR
jgi:hypothetical protein